jgi:peptide/nickel transport system substrate-binding protein
MKVKRLFTLILAVIMVVTAFTGCTGNTVATSDEILRFGTSGYDGVLNPIMTDNVYDSYATALIFESLIKIDKTGAYNADLASWKVSDDHLTYTFTLKDGIKFSDGTALTADDVYYTYSTIAHKDYNGPRAYAVADMVGYEDFKAGKTQTFEGIKVVDAKTISFTFAEGKASPANIECFTYGILSKDYYKFAEWEDFTNLNEKPMGSGVMVLEDFAPKEFIKMLRNENYWNAKDGAKIGGLYFLEVPDETLVSALQTDQIDFAQVSASQDNLTALKELTNVHPINYLGNGYTFMCFNTKKPTLSDKRVRQALLYSLNRKDFIKIQYGEGIAEVGMAPISPVSWAFPTEGLNAYDFDMDKAGKLMDEAGWKMGSDGFRYKDNQKFSIGWLVYSDAPWPGKLSSMAADTWKQLGVDLKIEIMDFTTVSDKTMDSAPEDRVFDIYTMGFSLGVDPDPTGALFDDNASEKGGFNASGYKNDAAMELVKEGKAEFDTKKRATIYKEWAKIMNEEIPHAIVAYRSEIWGINNKIKGMDEINTYQDFTSLIKTITVEAPKK